MNLIDAVRRHLNHGDIHQSIRLSTIRPVCVDTCIALPIWLAEGIYSQMEYTLITKFEEFGDHIRIIS